MTVAAPAHWRSAHMAYGGSRRLAPVAIAGAQGYWVGWRLCGSDDLSPIGGHQVAIQPLLNLHPGVGVT